MNCNVLIREYILTRFWVFSSFNVNLWPAPGKNIHRNHQNGRNFEYYSEDHLINGNMAAALTKDVQKHKNRAITIKHFAFNNQEMDIFNDNSLLVCALLSCTEFTNTIEPRWNSDFPHNWKRIRSRKAKRNRITKRNSEAKRVRKTKIIGRRKKKSRKEEEKKKAKVEITRDNLLYIYSRRDKANIRYH